MTRATKRSPEIPERCVRGASLRLLIDLLMALLCCGVTLLSVSFAVVPSDTTHCGPQVLVREKATRQPVHWASVYVRPKASPDQDWSLVRQGQVGGDGVIDFMYLKPGAYEVALIGVSRVRELAEWEPPPPDTSGEVRIGPDPWKRPIEGQRFRLRRTWRVRHGNCSDRLIVDVEPTPWVVQTGEKRIDTTPIWGHRSSKRRRP